MTEHEATIRPEVASLVERGSVTTDEVDALRCTYSEWVKLIPAMTDEAFGARVERAIRHPDGEPLGSVYAPELLRRFRGAARAARSFAESLDNVREALGQDQTHHLVMAGDVEELVKAVEHCDSDGVLHGCHGMTVLKRLRERA